MSFNPKQRTVPCECGKSARLVPGSTVYPRHKQLWQNLYYLCQCGRYVGCHAGSTRPLGTPADAATRQARAAAHAAFDPLWQAKMRRDQCSKTQARTAGYAWLAGKLGIEVEACHIGAMDRATADRVVELCQKR